MCASSALPYSNAEFSPHTTSGMRNRTARVNGMAKSARCMAIAVEPKRSNALSMSLRSTSGSML